MATRFGLEETRPTGHGRARGLVSNRASGRRIEAKTYAVPPDLEDVVMTVWSGRWDLRDQPPHTTELLADPCVNIVFETGGPHAGARVVGVWTTMWTRTLEGRGRVRAVKLRAGATRAFFDVSAHELANQIVDLEDVMPEVLAVGSVLEPDDDVDAFKVVIEWLRRRRRKDDAADVSLAVALVDRIACDSELTTVDQLVAVAGISVRPLQRLFRAHVGASPKWVIRRNRLQEVALRIESGVAPNLADLAATLGYADQAHLARDFKAAVGRPPSAFATNTDGS